MKAPLQVGREYKMKDGRKYVRTFNGKFVFKKFTYPEVKYDPDGWADAAKYLPDKFDLVKVKIKNGGYKSAWHQGNAWEGYRIKPEDEILYWKKTKGEL